MYFFQSIPDLGSGPGYNQCSYEYFMIIWSWEVSLSWIFEKLHWNTLCTKSDTCKYPTALGPP